MKYLSYLILVVLLILSIIEFLPTVGLLFSHLEVYQWLIYGFLLYFILRRIGFFTRNERWLQVTSHETTHAIVGMMFFHKIHSLEAKDSHGTVSHSGRNFGGIFISLAPYCLPVITYVLLLLRLIGASRSLYVFDLLVGFTLGFYVLCFFQQISPSQDDLQRHGVMKSFLFIFVSWFFNATIILLSIRKGIWEAFIYIFHQYWNDIETFVNCIFC